MKKSLVFFFTLVTQLAIAQTIRIADNNANAPTGANIFTGANALQNAINAAVVNDIVYVQPSPTTYGTANINKKITLRGIGFATGQPFNSNVGAITLTNTSDNLSNASGTIVEGLQVVSSNINVGTQSGINPYTLQNVTISNCVVVGNIYRVAGYQPATNLTVKNCYTGIYMVSTTPTTQLYIYNCRLYNAGLGFGLGQGQFTNVIISNNIIHQSTPVFFNGAVVSGAVLANNNFLGGTATSSSNFSSSFMADWLVTNNIFYGFAPNSTSGTTFERNTYTNNISIGTTNNALPPAVTGTGNTGSGNKPSENPLFVNAPLNTAYTGNEDFNLPAGSPAKNAGFDGTDMGITGGAYPVTEGNIKFKNTAIPVITVFTPAAIVPQNQPVKANIKAKSN